MSNATYSSAAFKAASTPTVGTFLREFFVATPLYIFVTAVKSALASR
jgi:hypothetical protein